MQTTLPTQPDFKFVVPSFLPTDGPIASLNKAMLFLSSAISSRYPPTNNQLKNSSNLNSSNNSKWPSYSSKCSRKTVSRGEGHMAKQCIAKKRVKDSEWFKVKMLLAQAQEAGVILQKDQKAFLANRLEEMEDYCDDEATSCAIFMASLSVAGSLSGDIVAPTYDSDILFEVPHYELTSNNNVISYADYIVTIENDVDQYVLPPEQDNAMILSVIEQMKCQVEKCNT
ncbi:hypothetical protein Tco_0107685, partial [Tanacetum coccineum]